MAQAANRNEQIVLDLFASMNAKDHGWTARLLHDDIAWTAMVVGLPGSGTKRGKEMVVRDLLAFPSTVFRPGDPVAEVDRIVSAGDFVMAETRTRGEHQDGRVYTNHYAWAVELRDGLIIAVRHYFDSFNAQQFFGINPLSG